MLLNPKWLCKERDALLGALSTVELGSPRGVVNNKVQRLRAHYNILWHGALPGRSSRMLAALQRISGFIHVISCLAVKMTLVDTQVSGSR